MTQTTTHIEPDTTMRAKSHALYLDFTIGNKKLYIVRDHAMALMCWRRGLDIGLIQKRATLVHIDAHTDFTLKEANKEPSRGLLVMDEGELLDFIGRLSKDNSEFIANAMFAQMVGDGVAIYHRTGHDVGVLKKGGDTTTDRRVLDDHTMYLCHTENISDIHGYEGYVGDVYRHQDTNALLNNATRIILDIDLDYFTYLNGPVYMKHPADIRRQLSSKAFELFWNKAAVMTIALEPSCCGGKEQCMDIVELFDEVLFKPRGVSIYSRVEEFLR